MKKAVFLLIILLLISFHVFSSTITLKNGKVIKGKIIHASTNHITVDIDGKVLDYGLSEIKSIDGKKITYQSAKNDYAEYIAKNREYSLELSKAQQLLQERRFEDAETAYEAALELKPDSVIAFNGLAITNISMGKLDIALDYCQKGIAVDPEFPNIYGVRGQIYLFLKNYDLAESDFKKAIGLIEANAKFSKDEQLKRLKDYISELTEELNRRKQLVAAGNLPVGVRPEPTAFDNFLDHFNKGKDYVLTGQYLMAITELEKALKYKKDDYQTFNLLGDAYDGLGRYEQAKKAYLDSISLKPDYPEANYNLAILYANRLRDKEKAIEYFKHTIQADPLSAKAYHNLGIIYKSLADYDQSIDYFKKAIDIFQIKGELHHVERLEQDLKSIYQKTGRYPEHASNMADLGKLSDPFYLAVLSAAVLIIIYGLIIFWTKARKAAIPLAIAILGGWSVFLSFICAGLAFINYFKIENEGLLIIVNLFISLIAVFLLGAGLAMLHLQYWIRNFFLFFILSAGFLSVAAAAFYKRQPVEIVVVFSIFLAHFMLFYFGLEKKYFDKDGQTWLR
ncbi:MAG: tetratricopeptide repeat protein [Candidatus Omnitrophica bacterium]|nr:tetratricopeptide repeat protein [Candidatus Omnitrophota bacterium]